VLVKEINVNDKMLGIVDVSGILACLGLLGCSLSLWRIGYVWEVPCIPKKGDRSLNIDVPREMTEDEVEVYIEQKVRLLAENGNKDAIDIINGYATLKLD